MAGSNVDSLRNFVVSSSVALDPLWIATVCQEFFVTLRTSISLAQFGYTQGSGSEKCRCCVSLSPRSRSFRARRVPSYFGTKQLGGSANTPTPTQDMAQTVKPLRNASVLPSLTSRRRIFSAISSLRRFFMKTRVICEKGRRIASCRDSFTQSAGPSSSEPMLAEAASTGRMC
jgi:hypothetical protein